MSKAVKDMMISGIRERLGDCRDLLVVDVSRLDAVTDNKFRLALRERGIQILQVKNTLVRKVLESTGGGSLDHCLQGPSAIVWGGEDAVALSKEIARWAKELEPLQIKGATVDGQPLNAAAVDALSKSPGRLELLGQISGLLLSPGARLSAALLGPGGKLQGQIKTLAEGDAGSETAA
ncbi:MAG: 50S ribosomal protein L10 [Planctomycetaceae bacterium]|nr:50S ribosomal protein L10 [Planctomycetaceae bacterium]